LRKLKRLNKDTLFITSLYKRAIDTIKDFAENSGLESIEEVEI
jgi:hypothetical protein